MKFRIEHDIKGRMRIHVWQKSMTYRQADTLFYYLHSLEFVNSAKVYELTADAAISYVGDRQQLIDALKSFSYETAEVDENLVENSGRELNAIYREKLICQTIYHFGRKFLLPFPLRAAYTTVKSAGYIAKGIKCLAQRKIEVSVLDATAIGVSVLRGDFDTAGSVMYLLGIGETLEEWTHKKSVGDLARSMSLNVSKVWLSKDGQEILVPSSEIKAGDDVVVRMGNVVPFDGEVIKGEAMINQASMTGESAPVRKEKDGYVYAGTVVEEGEITVKVKQTSGSTKFEKIVSMIEDSQKLKSQVEGRAEHLADKLVPYTLLGTGAVYAITRNVTKALSVLMVDFSCALKLAMPIAVLSAIREAGIYKITVKGGKYL